MVSSLGSKSPSCRLSDGRVLSAAVVKNKREHDLAVLRIDATDLSIAKWSIDDNPRIGAILAMPAAGGEFELGLVSHAVISLRFE